MLQVNYKYFKALINSLNNWFFVLNNISCNLKILVIIYPYVDRFTSKKKTKLSAKQSRLDF